MLNIGCSTKKNYTTEQLLEESKRSHQRAVLINQHLESISNTVELFKSSFKDYQKETLLAAINKIYAVNAFVNDRIHSVTGRSNIHAYFESTFEKMEWAKFETLNEDYGKTDVYLNWIMKIKLKNRTNVLEFLGTSILRFNKDGEVIYHQDYWDFSELVQEIGFIGGIMNWIKSNA